MSIQLSIFSEVAVLRVQRAIGARQVQVLGAGIRRLFETGVKVVVVDLRHAKLDEPAVAASKVITPAVCKNQQGIRVVIVDPSKQVGEFESLVQALESLDVADKKELTVWFEAEDEAAQLEARKAELEKQLGANGEEWRQRIRKARGDRARNLQLKEALSRALSAWNGRLASWRKVA